MLFVLLLTLFKLLLNVFIFFFSVKYVGIFSYLLGLWIVAYSCWEMLSNQNISIRSILFYSLGKLFIAIFVSVGVYLLIFYLHLSFLTKAGPHDSVMTSAFQASLEVRKCFL